MPKTKTVFICQSCGAHFPKWQGQCGQCGEWNTLAETVVSEKSTKSKAPSSKGGRKKIQNLGEIKSDFKRTETGIFEFDRVLGGGIVPGSVLLLAGEPGIGKSTLLLQVANAVSGGEGNSAEKTRPRETRPDESGRVEELAGFGESAGSVLYVCGEESPVQIKSRAKRLGIQGENLQLLPETDVDVINETVRQLDSSAVGQSEKETDKLIIIDSVQTLTTEDLSGGAGSIGQVRECSDRLRKVAKEEGISVILVGHVTKSGSVAGPKVLEHIVDGVFTLEGDKFHEFRILRASKNRFGSSFEVGVFEMGDAGLREVENPSALFISQRSEDSPGSVITATLEGTRPVLVEIQALTADTKFKYPRRSASGFSNKRLEILCAVLERRVGLNLQGQDIYVNVASGLKVFEPAADLGVVLALVSAASGSVVSPKVCAFGEVGLSGELRDVAQSGRREEEAERLGFKEIVAPPEVSSIEEALSKVNISL